MSLHDWKVTGATPFVGLANYAKMLQDERFLWAIVRTLWFTAATVDRAGAAGRLGRRLLRLAVQAARPGTHAVRAADDGDAGGDRAGVDDDVPPAAWRAELPADLGRAAAIELGLRQQHRDPDAGDGRDLAMDAAGHADRAGRHRQPAAASPTRRRSSTAPAPGRCSATSPCRWSGRSSWSPR